MRRSADTLQFGLAGPHAVVLDGLTPPLLRLVAALDGTRWLADVVADAVAAGAAPAAAYAVLHRLRAAGVLVDVADPAPGGLPGVLVHGGGRVAVALACLLAGSGACRVAVAAQGEVAPDDVGTGLGARDVGRPRAGAVAEALARASGRAADAVARPDLVVLADGPVPDPAVVATLRGPHLPVAARDGLGVVGPLVLPGRTPCLRCDDLARAQDDPAWPVIAAQLCRRRPPVGPALAGATAALAADQILAVLHADGPPPPAVGAVLELDPRTGSLRRRALGRHPACGCGAPSVGTTTTPGAPRAGAA